MRKLAVRRRALRVSGESVVMRKQAAWRPSTKSERQSAKAP